MSIDTDGVTEINKRIGKLGDHVGDLYEQMDELKSALTPAATGDGESGSGSSSNGIVILNAKVFKVA